ncbi:hypothetical protein L1887_19925 [Cichorium endivia]|nr:hypothetical protein L1887_19925 [Cichorium endivia]
MKQCINREDWNTGIFSKFTKYLAFEDFRIGGPCECKSPPGPPPQPLSQNSMSSEAGQKFPWFPCYLLSSR